MRSGLEKANLELSANNATESHKLDEITPGRSTEKVKKRAEK